MSDEDSNQETTPSAELIRRERSTPNSPIRRGSSTPSSVGIKAKCLQDLTCGCGKRFLDASQLYYHQIDLQHFTDKYCRLCDKRFKKLSNFKRHNDSQHSIQKPQHPCSLCKKVFARYDNLQEHELKKHSTISCRNCHEHFDNRQDLKEHVKAAHRGIKMLQMAILNPEHAE